MIIKEILPEFIMDLMLKERDRSHKKCKKIINNKHDKIKIKENYTIK